MESIFGADFWGVCDMGNTEELTELTAMQGSVAQWMMLSLVGSVIERKAFTSAIYVKNHGTIDCTQLLQQRVYGKDAAANQRLRVRTTFSLRSFYGDSRRV